MNPAPDASRTAPFLLEIGSEEIPARFIPDAMTELAARFAGALAENHLAAGGVRVVATPRRLALMADEVAVRQPDREVVVKGPPVKVAFDDSGAPTPAGLGFARKAGVDLAACERASDARGEYLQVVRTEAGRPAAEVLGELLPELILGLPFRKVMRWGDLDLEYPRPLQWLVALLDEDIVPFHLEGYEAGRVSRGHRTLDGDSAVTIAAAADYVESLRGHGVIVDPAERRRTISEGLAATVAAWNPDAELLADDGLLEEVVQLCEHPTPFLGAFDVEFTELPAEVITTALKAHQRYFSVGRTGGGDLLPAFAAVRDGGTEHLDNVIRGNERVLRARLADAMFYWTFDQKKSPDERVALLDTVTWLEGFGSVGDKTERLRALAPWLWTAGLGEGDAPPAHLDRAATLAKSDLVSEMIRDGKEFTKLEGFIGARYAELAGEAPEVCRAMEDHYAPRSAHGAPPEDAVSATLAVADRLDNVAGCWLAGFVPTGAKDPYALRRQVLAVVRILLSRQARLDLREALARALAALAGYAPDRDLDAVGQELAEFVRTRLDRHLVEVGECDPEVVRAVLPVRWADPVDARHWIAALAGYRDRADFLSLARGFKRCRNILEGEVLPMTELEACLERWCAGGSGSGGENLTELPDPAERTLLAQVAAMAPQLVQAEADGAYETVFDFLSSLGPAIDTFFDTVRVNVEDDILRTRRRAFLREIHGLFARYADFAVVAPAED